MTVWRRFLVLGIGAMAIGAVQTRAQSVEIKGTLITHALPMTYAIQGVEMYFKDGRPYAQVSGQGDCHYEPHENCYFVGNPPHYVCYPEGQWQCFNDAADYSFPVDLVKLEGKDVFYTGGGKHLKIGHVKSFLFWTWISLQDNTHVQATPATCALLIDTGTLAGPAAHATNRAETFAALHGSDRTVGMMVRFSGLTNQAARHILRACGYEGDLAPTNDWSKSDVTHDEIGIAITPDRAADLIGKLRVDERVTGIRPVQ